MSGESLRFVSTDDEATRLSKLDRALERVREVESANLVADFDAAWAEQSRAAEPKYVRFGGRTFEVPSSMPANFAMFYMRRCLRPKPGGGYDFVVPEDKLGEMLTLALGEELADAIQASRVSLTFVTETMLVGIMSAWGVEINAGGDAGK